MKKISILVLLGFLFLPAISFGETSSNPISDIQNQYYNYWNTNNNSTTNFSVNTTKAPTIQNWYIQDAKNEAQKNYDSLIKEKQRMDFDNPNNTKSEADINKEISDAKTRLDALDTPEWQAAAIKKAEDKIAADKAAAKREIDPNNLAWSNFQLDVNSLTPGENKYSWWAKENINSIINKITKVLLLVIPSLAVLFIVYGAIKIILAWWDSSKVGTGKTIIQFNIIAVVLALLSYSIIQLVIWLLGWNI